MRCFALLPLCALCCAGCVSSEQTVYPEVAEYVVIPAGGAVLEKPHYDRKLGGFWLTGMQGTVHLDPISEPLTCGVVLSLRTEANAKTQSHIAAVRLATPDYLIVARPGSDQLTITKTTDETAVKVVEGTDYIRFRERNKRVEVVFSEGFIRDYAPFGAAVTWFPARR